MTHSNKDKWIRCRASDQDLKVIQVIQERCNYNMSVSQIIRAALYKYLEYMPFEPEPQFRRAHGEQLHVDQSCV